MLFDPALDVAASVAEMLAGPEADRPFSSASPREQGPDWDVEEVGEFGCVRSGRCRCSWSDDVGRPCQQTVSNPLSRVSFRCSLLLVVAGGEVVLVFADAVSDLQLEGF